MSEQVQPRRLSTPTPPTEPPSSALVPIRRPVSGTPATTPRSSKQPEYRPGSIAGTVGELRDVAEREIKATGKVVQNLPASMTKFFGGLAIDATWGVGRSILYGGGKSPFSIGSEYVPKTMNETVESFVNTAKVWERIPQYWETIEAGEAISPMLIEDLGNLSIIGRGVRAPIKATAATATRRAQGATNAATTAGTAQEAAKAATRAARLSTIADRANKLTNTTNRIIYYTDKAGNFPFMPYVWAGKGLGKAYREGTYVEGLGGWGAQAAEAYIAQIDALRQAEPNIDPQDPRLRELTKKANSNLRRSLSHSTRQQIRQAVRNGEHEYNAVSKAVSNIAQNPLLKDEINPATGEAWGELSPAENQAIISVLNGRAALIKGLSERLGVTPDRLAELGKYDETPEYWLSPEGATLAMDFIEGRLTPEHYDRLSNALDSLAKQIIMNTQQAVEGFGRRNLLSPDYLVPLPFVNKLKQAVMQSKNGQLIELWLALEEAGLLIPLSQALETFTPEQLKLREEAMVAFVQNLPDELALDPSMYPANMRENIEFYRRVRRSLNQRATGTAVKEPIPPVDGSPRAPEDPFFPFEEDVEAGIEAPTGPEQFPMPRSRGKIDAAETMLGKATQKIEKLRAKVIEIADKIADLEVKQAKLEERVRKYDIVDAYLAGMEPKAIARRFRLSINDVDKILKRSRLANEVATVRRIQEDMDALTKTIGVKRAALRGDAADAELLALEEQYATLLREATNAQKAVAAATSMNEIARLADDSAIERLTEEMDLAEDQLIDRETEYEDAGGDINDLRVDVDPKDPEVGPVSPEIAETYLNNLTGLVEDISVKFGSDPIGPVLSRSVEVLNQAWNQAIDFYESASTDAQTLVGELRLQQLSDLIADVTETINQLITEPQEGVLLEQAIADTLVNLVNDPRSQQIIAGTAPFVFRLDRNIKPLLPEGMEMPTLAAPRNPWDRAQKIDVFDYTPKFDPSNITGSIFKLVTETLQESNNYDKAVEFEYRILRGRDYYPDVTITWEPSDSSIEFEIITENLSVTISFNSRDSLSINQVRETLNELKQEAETINLDSEYLTEPEVYLTGDESYYIISERGALGSYEQFLESYNGLNNIFDQIFSPESEAVASPTGPRLRAVDEMIEAGAPLPDPGLEAIAQQMAEDLTLINDIALDVEDYRSVTQAIEELRNPTPEAIETFRAQAVEAAQQELNTSLGLLENLGGVVTGNNVTFRINVRRGTPEWEWWENLDPNVRRNIARKYFRSDKIKSGAAKGPRTVQKAFNVDQFASEVNLDVEQWADQFLEGIRLHGQAQKNLKEVKSGDIDVETFVRENPELQELEFRRDQMENDGIDPATVDVYDRARIIRAERQDADIPNDPAEVRPNPELVNPGVRAAAYEADVLVAMAKEATAKMRKAESASKRLEAFEEYLRDYNARVEAEGNVLRLRNVARNARISLDKNLERQRKLRDKSRGAKAEIKNTVALQNRLTGDESFDLIRDMPGAVPLEIALEGGYPSEQFSVDVPVGPRDARTVEPVTLQGPMYLPTGRPRPFTGGLSTEVLKAGLPGFDKLTSEHFRDGDRQTIFSIRLLADRMGKEARMMTENEAYRAIVAQFGDTAVDLIGREESFALYEKAYQLVSNMSESSQLAFAASVLDETGEQVVNLLPKVDGIGAYASGVPDPRAVFNLALREQYGRLIAQEMQFRGYLAVDPYKRITGVVPFDQITHESMFLPVGLREQIALREAIVDPNGFNAFLKSAHRVTSFMKSTTLVLSVAWQLGDLYSNIVIAQMTGVNVPDMLAQMRRVKVEEYGTGWAGFKAMIDPRTQGPTPTAVVRIAQESPIQDIGFSQAERAFLRGMPLEEPTPLLSRVSRGRLQYPAKVQGRSITKVSFKINETINRISRHAYFLELLERRLQEQGRTLDEVAADGSWRTDPQTKKLVFQVADTANDWLGDFANLTLAERKYMVPLVPFYSWTKHIHKVFLMMGREHPQSLRWYIYLGTLNFDPDEDPMNLRYGNPSVFGGAVNLNPFNPFADVFAGPAASLISEGNIQPALSQLGPVPRLLGGAFGFDVTKARPLQRPPGSGGYTESGLEQLTSLYRDPREALGFGLMQFPIAARALNIIPGERIPGTQIALGPVTRYQTGEARLKPGTERRIERPGGRAAAVGRLFSVPLIPYQSDEQIDEVMRSAKRRLKTVARLKKRRERYLRSLDD
jgi:hypothetical protein